MNAEAGASKKEFGNFAIGRKNGIVDSEELTQKNAYITEYGIKSGVFVSLHGMPAFQVHTVNRNRGTVAICYPNKMNLLDEVDPRELGITSEAAVRNYWKNHNEKMSRIKKSLPKGDGRKWWGPKGPIP